MRDVVSLMGPLGVDQNDVHMVGMRTEIKRQKKDVTEQGAKSSANSRNMILVNELKLMGIPCKVQLQV